MPDRQTLKVFGMHVELEGSMMNGHHLYHGAHHPQHMLEEHSLQDENQCLMGQVKVRILQKNQLRSNQFLGTLRPLGLP